MSTFKRKTVLVPGGASGIGRLMGEKCLRLGASRVIIWDINPKGMEETLAHWSSLGFDAEGYLTDLSDVTSIEDAARQTMERHGAVDILFNNAGIVVGKMFEDHSREDIDKTLAINVAGVMHVARVVLPGMIRKGEGHIINIASAAGLTANPKMSVYAASKWAVMGWSESLRLEMERLHPGIKVTTVAPSYIKTGMFDGAKAPLVTPLLEPEFLAGRVIEAVKNNEIMVMEPASVNLLGPLKGLLPTRVFDFVADKVFGVYNTMDEFKGRNG